MLFIEVVGFFLILGIPTGLAISQVSKRFDKTRCSGTHERSNKRCNGKISKICIDNLCAEHCKFVHDTTCTDKFLK